MSVVVSLSVAAVAVFVIVKLAKFMMRGGTFTLPAVNSTHLYYQIRRVYDKMEPACAAYFALLINSAAVRDKFSEFCLLTMVRDFKSDDDWANLCSMYVCMWQESVAGKYISPNRIVELGLHDQILRCIERSKQDILSGGRQYENLLRGMSQAQVMSVVFGFQEFRLRHG